MTNVTTGTEHILRHHIQVPTPCVVGDLEQLMDTFNVQGPKGSNMDRAQVLADDTAVHVVWEEVLDGDVESSLDNFQSWLIDAYHSNRNDLLMADLDKIDALVKAYKKTL